MVAEDVRERIVSYIRHQAGKPDDEIASLVAESQQRLLDVVGALPDDRAAAIPDGETWSVRHLIRHVIDAETSVERLVYGLARGERPDAGNRGVGAMIDDDGTPFAALLEQLRGANARIVATVRGLPADADLMATAKHPFFGALNCREWAAFQRVHDADHIQHAQKILGALAPM
jgi:hypothetical protein